MEEKKKNKSNQKERLLWFLCDHCAHDCGIHFPALIWGVRSVSPPPPQKKNHHFGGLQSKALQPHRPRLPAQPCLTLASCLSALTAAGPALAGAGESGHAATCISASRRSRGCRPHAAADTGGSKAISALAACETPAQLSRSLPAPRPSAGMEGVMLL